MTKKFHTRILMAALTVFAAAPAAAFDLGFFLDQSAALDLPKESAGGFSYAGAAVPWFSMPLPPVNGGLYVSAAWNLTLEREEWSAAPELLRTELTLRPAGGLVLRAGRLPWEDPLGFIAGGLFDGAAFTAAQGEGEWSAALFYTGLLYKRAANITITEAEEAAWAEPLDGSRPRSYFASRRLLAALGWEHPGIAELLSLRTALILQCDLRPAADLAGGPRFHSGYLAASAYLPLGDMWSASAGAVLEAALSSKTAEGGALENGVALAGEAALSFFPPTDFPDRVTLLGRFSSGSAGPFAAFVPVTTEPQGRILRAKLSGLSMIRASWEARLHRSFTLTAEASSFMSAAESGGNGEGVRVLGTEFFAEALWSPLSDLQLRLGGGAFAPALGNASPGDPLRWRVKLDLLLAVY